MAIPVDYRFPPGTPEGVYRGRHVGERLFPVDPRDPVMWWTGRHWLPAPGVLLRFWHRLLALCSRS